MNINSLHDLYKTTGTVGKPRRTSVSSEKKGEAVHSAPQDAINISSEGAFRAGLAAVVREAAPAFDEPISAERLAALREAYAGDNCPVSSADIADAMLERVMGAVKA